MNMTVHQLKCVIREMKDCVYPFDDKKAQLSTLDIRSREHDTVEIYTKDETTGIEIVMTKHINQGDYADENIN